MRIFLVIVAVLASQQALAEQDCSKALIKKELFLSKNWFVRSAYLNRVSKTQFEQESANGSFDAVIGEIPIGGGYESYKKFFGSFDQLTRTEFTGVEELNMMQAGLDPAAAEAYKTCLKTEDSARFVAWVARSDHDTVTVSMRWKPQGQLLRRILIEFLSGASTQSRQIAVPEDNAKLDLSFSRHRSQPFTLTLNAIARNARGEDRAYSDTVSIPWVPNVVVKWREFQRTSSDQDVLVNGVTALRVDNNMSEGGAVSKPFSYNARPYFYIANTIPAWNPKVVAGLSCGYQSLPKSGKDLTISASVISGEFSLTVPPHCGGGLEGHLAWKELYPLIEVDGRLSNPLPGWVENKSITEGSAVLLR